MKRIADHTPLTANVPGKDAVCRQTRVRQRADAQTRRGEGEGKIAQDWGLWCKNGYVDFVCPMDYMNSVSMFKRTIEKHKKVLNGVKCYPGIGYSVMRTKPYADKPVRLAEQVMAVRECGYPGFTVFDYTPPTATALKKVFGRKDPK